MIARRSSYHGNTLGALDASGKEPLRKPYTPWLGRFLHAPAAYEYRCENPQHPDGCGAWHARRARTDDLSSPARRRSRRSSPSRWPAPRSPAPCPCDDYWPAIVEVCRRHGVLVIADEVMTGFGRTGRWFGVDHWGVRPDILTAGKGTTSGYVPFGFAAASGEVFDAVATTGFVHGFTWSHNALGAAAGRRGAAPARRGRPGRARAPSAGRTDPQGPARRARRTLRSWATCAGSGMMIGIELVRDRRDEGAVRAHASASPSGRAAPRGTPGCCSTPPRVTSTGRTAICVDAGAAVRPHRRRRRDPRRAHRGRDPFGARERTASGSWSCPEARIYDHGPQHPLRPATRAAHLGADRGLRPGRAAERRTAPERRAGRRRDARARAHAGVHRRDAARGPRRGRRLGAGSATGPATTRSSTGCTRRARSWRAPRVDGGASRLAGDVEHAFNAAGRAAPRDARPRVGLLRLRRSRGRDRVAAARRASSGSPTSTSTCTTATAAGDLLRRPARADDLDPRVRARLGSSPARARSPSAAVRAPRGAPSTCRCRRSRATTAWLDGVPRRRCRRWSRRSRPTCS